MIGIGTLVNTALVIVGGITGLLLKQRLSRRFQDTIVQAIGLAVIFIGVSGTLEKMLVPGKDGLTTHGSILAIGVLVGGAIIGELLNIEQRFENLGARLKRRFASKDDTRFVDGFVTATLTICVGAMAIIGSLQDGLAHDPSMLFTKALLDGFIVAIFSAAFGIGPIFAAIPLFVLQGSITLLAGLVAPYLTDEIISNLSFIGNMLIFCVGINLLFPVKIKVANLLPSLVLVIIWLRLFPG